MEPVINDVIIHGVFVSLYYAHPDLFLVDAELMERAYMEVTGSFPCTLSCT